MRRITFLCLTALLLTFPTFAQEEAESAGRIQGWVELSDNTLVANATVMVCSYYCDTTQTDFYGHFEFPAHSYPTSSGTLTFYAWIDSPPGRTGMWGSNEDRYISYPVCSYYDQFGNCVNNGLDISFFLFPRPLQPQLLQPVSGASGIPLNGLQLSWTDGLDAARRQFSSAGRPYSSDVTYDIYGSGNGIPPTLYASNVPCNPGANGACNYTVTTTLAPSTYYQWYVKAKYHVPLYGYNIYLTKQSPTSSFTTTGSANMTYSFRTYYSYYLSATNCGGSDLNGNGRSYGSCEKFRIQDVNGGDLMNGDEIHLIAYNGSYWSAVNGGGGAVNANAAYPGAWETFHIWKLNNSGQGSIISSDNVAISCSNGQYVVAEGGGGGVVNCNRTTAAQWETFGVNTWP